MGNSQKDDKQQYAWESLSEKKLLALPLDELELSLSAAPFLPWVEQYKEEIRERKLRLQPHLWISDEWFSPEGIPGIAIPFYLCHPRLKNLQRKFLYQVDGGQREEFLCIIRHEAGHAFEAAYQLSKRKTWQRIFGSPGRPYPTTSYAPNPFSNRYVQNLKFWYAQSHPVEDFAETFAVCLRSGYDWRRRYKKAPVALKKLEYVEQLFRAFREKPPKIRSRATPDHLSRLKFTLKEHFENKRKQYQLGDATSVDGTLLRLFTREHSAGALRVSTFLKRNRTILRRMVGRWTNASPVVVDFLLEDYVIRAREMKLYLARPSHETLLDTLCLLTHEVVLLSTTKKKFRIPF